MKSSDKLTKNGAAVLVGTDVLDLYLNEISWNLRTMRSQADVLETVILELQNRIANLLPRETAGTSQYPAASSTVWSVAHQAVVSQLEIETSLGHRKERPIDISKWQISLLPLIDAA